MQLVSLFKADKVNLVKLQVAFQTQVQLALVKAGAGYGCNSFLLLLLPGQ